MPNERNGRNVAMPDDNRPSRRPQDDNGQRARRALSDRDDRDRERDPEGHWDDRTSRRDDRSIEHYGQGQSGYGAGRHEGDRSFSSRSRDMIGERDRASQHTYRGRWDDEGGRGPSGQQLGYAPRAWRDPDYRPEHEEYGIVGDEEFSHDSMYGRGRDRNMYGDRSMVGHRGERIRHRSAVHSQPPPPHSPEDYRPGMYGRADAVGRQGPHRGKGPAGYTRSDERIREMVCDVLTDHGEIDATNIEVAVSNGEVTLTGTVDERRTKRLAEDVIEQLSGVQDVVNNLRVADRKAATTATMGTHAGGSAVETSPAAHAGVSGNGNAGDRGRS